MCVVFFLVQEYFLSIILPSEVRTLSMLCGEAAD